jgi:hypothetical protein
VREINLAAKQRNTSAAHYHFGSKEELFAEVVANIMAVKLGGSGDVTSAEPNGLVGGQNFWTPSLLINNNWRWTIDDGFLDCFDGCDCHRAYVMDTTTAGAVNLVSYQEYGQSWCDFGTP